jgi:hypothetical protein
VSASMPTSKPRPTVDDFIATLEIILFMFLFFFGRLTKYSNAGLKIKSFRVCDRHSTS